MWVGSCIQPLLIEMQAIESLCGNLAGGVDAFAGRGCHRRSLSRSQAQGKFGISFLNGTVEQEQE